MGWLVHVLALGVLVWVLAHWIWAVMTPRPSTQVVSPLSDAAAVLSEHPPFGRAAAFPSAALQNARPAAGEVVLLGVAAQADGGGWALLRVGDTRVRLVEVGREIEPGERLEQVFPRGVELSKAGVSRRIELGRGGISAVARSAAGEPVANCPSSPEERKRAFFVHPELLAGFARSLDAARKHFRQEGGAWVVVELAPALAALGFSLGDRIERGNGVALLTEDSLRSAIFEPVLQSRMLRLSGTRKGKPKEWIFVNAALCSR